MFSDILILRIKNGRDFFITVAALYKLSGDGFILTFLYKRKCWRIVLCSYLDLAEIGVEDGTWSQMDDSKARLDSDFEQWDSSVLVEALSVSEVEKL